MDKENIVVQRDKKIVRTSVIAILTNLCLVTFKAIVGLMANSIAIVLDALNNLSDALSSVITILGTKLAGRPADAKHPFGYGRVEYLTAIIIACMVLAAGAGSASASVKNILHPQAASYSVVTLVIVVVGIATKLVLGTYTKKVGKETDSDALVASGADATFDALISAGTLVAGLVNFFTGYVIDGWVGAIISIAILKAGLEMLMDTLNSIVGGRADAELTQEIKAKLRTVDGVLGAYDLVLHNYGPTKMMGSVNVSVYDWRTAEELHAISKKAQKLILDEYDMELYVGFYAVNTKENDLKKLELEVGKDLANYKYVMAMHAFYEDHMTKDISFDAVIDFKCQDATYLVAQIEKDLGEKYGRTFRIQIDRAYSD
ncbi:MAG: cation transporter [Ruminiclostridium sp.]|nr:cation transporter [Ruminiclostridium sp.]